MQSGQFEFAGNGISPTLFGLMVACVLTTSVDGKRASAADNDGSVHSFDLTRVVGTKEANCQKCHPSEVAQWEKTTHFLSTGRLKYEGNSKKYADALGISAASLAKDSLCATCHATTAKRDGETTVISGVSCESCHGPAKDWLESHGTYHDGMAFKSLEQLRTDRKKETADHRKARLASIEKAGMIRPAAIATLARNCMDCHIIGNEKLVAAGHKAASAFELGSWSGGEVKHNFFMDKDRNADAPTLWMDSQKRTAAQRNRIKLLVGTLTQIETSLRRRAGAKSPAYIPLVGGSIAAANGKLAQINGVGVTPEGAQAMGLVAPMLGTLFVPQPNDAKTYGDAADKIAELTSKIVSGNDGSQLQGLDAMIKLVPPHYSQQYRKKHLK